MSVELVLKSLALRVTNIEQGINDLDNATVNKLYMGSDTITTPQLVETTSNQMFQLKVCSSTLYCSGGLLL